MVQLLHRLGTGLGLLGMLVCAATGVARLAGNPYLAGFETVTLFIAGIGLLAAASFLKLEAANCNC